MKAEPNQISRFDQMWLHSKTYHTVNWQLRNTAKNRPKILSAAQNIQSIPHTHSVLQITTQLHSSQTEHTTIINVCQHCRMVTISNPADIYD